MGLSYHNGLGMLYGHGLGWFLTCEYRNGGSQKRISMPNLFHYQVSTLLSSFNAFLVSMSLLYWLGGFVVSPLSVLMECSVHL